MIGGRVDAGFEPVFRAFQDNFRLRGEVGASVVVYVDGQRVVDLHGGVRDKASGRRWTDDTVQILFSATKGLVAACFLVQMEAGEVDLDAPVRSIWPGFGRAGKDAITIRQVLNHTAGLAAIDRPLSLDELEGWSNGTAPNAVVEALEAQQPIWAPGSAQGYHAISYGLFAAEIYRRATGKTLSEAVRSLADTLGADVHLGLPADQEHRAATLYPVGPSVFVRKILPRIVAGRAVEGRIYRRFLDSNSASRRAFANPSELGIRGVKNFGTARVRAMALPWCSGTGSARGLAAVYDALSRPGALVSEASIAEVSRRQSWGWDKVLCKPMGFSQGFVKDELTLYSPSATTFGHPGAGGCLGFADPEARIGFGYVMNQMDFRLRSPRALALARAVYTCLT